MTLVKPGTGTPTWANMTPPNRDRWGRPLLTLPGEPKPVAHVRPSTLAKTLSDGTALGEWKARVAARAVATNPDLQALIATTSPDDTAKLRTYVQQALDVGGASSSASIGTAIHSATELLDAGHDITHLPADIRAAAESYKEALIAHDLEPASDPTTGIASEIFLRNDALTAAGSCDRVVQHTTSGRTAILDIKTSRKPVDQTAKYAAMEWSIQLSTYAHSVPYCATRGDLSWATMQVAAPSLKRAVVAHIDVSTPSKPTTTLLGLDIERGYEYALTALAVRVSRKTQSGLVAPL